MKRITILIGALAFAITSNAQNFYSFSQSTSTYADLDQPINMNFSENWSTGYYGSEPISFVFPVFDQEMTHFYFDGGVFYLTDETSMPYVEFGLFETSIRDRNFDNSDDASFSPVSYQVVGTAGNRILKFEVKNAGLSSEQPSGTSTHFLNYQIWLYESDNAIEYHYGSHNITSLTTLNTEGVFHPYLSMLAFTDGIIYNRGAISGTLASPVYTEFEDDDEDLISMNGIATPNTVYRFEVITLSNHDKEKVNFAMYPNPTSDVLNLTFSENLDKNYSVYDLLGREVLNGKFENTSEAQISVENLQIGTYILRIGGTNKKFIKK